MNKIFVNYRMLWAIRYFVRISCSCRRTKIEMKNTRKSSRSFLSEGSRNYADVPFYRLRRNKTVSWATTGSAWRLWSDLRLKLASWTRARGGANSCVISVKSWSAYQQRGGPQKNPAFNIQRRLYKQRNRLRNFTMCFFFCSSRRQLRLVRVQLTGP